MIISYLPQCPEQQVATASEASAHDVAEAAHHARRAQRSWAAAPAEQRASVLSAVAGAVDAASAELADPVVAEAGKPESLEAGQIRINTPTTGAAVHTPFGGMKGSSYGEREPGKAAQHFYTSVHTVAVRRPLPPDTTHQRRDMSSDRGHGA
ncbi:aldehyde dehydrogenase family protein [Streptomyces olivaceus]|uniref:aldehyde dehydrogenase family protein n=1 Tax=Streptomyces olivaceus TaxID=47716 RepID=UPI001CCD223A|nr:aldehyde dehydrogenase family protein [Streptomyces olivaceus]MBZ6226341.1 aldehyde dehydrogenase family protein [Streptomyces olivaceus]